MTRDGFGSMRRASAGRAGVFLAVAILPLIGCNWPERRLVAGTALRAYGSSEPAIGDTARSFAFTTADGQLKRLAAVRGRVTLLVFPDAADWPDCAVLRELANLARRESVYNVEVVVLSVGQPELSCDEALVAARGCGLPPEHVVLVCDPHGTVHTLYGAQARGRFFVLDNFLRVVEIGELSDLEGLRSATRRVVDEIFDLDLRMGAFDDDGDSE
jgi:peroxiredoxin